MTNIEYREAMLQEAKRHHEQHKSCCEWGEGRIKKVWIDGNGDMCIEYESGRWWHYNERGEWW